MRLDSIFGDQPPSLVRVALSERNLRTLLSKVSRDGSARTLRMHEGETVLEVVAERDDVHYEDRNPGPVHPLDDPGGW